MWTRRREIYYIFVRRNEKLLKLLKSRKTKKRRKSSEETFLFLYFNGSRKKRIYHLIKRRYIYISSQLSRFNLWKSDSTKLLASSPRESKAIVTPTGPRFPRSDYWIKIRSIRGSLQLLESNPLEAV